jgi:hypothetical protein
MVRSRLLPCVLALHVLCISACATGQIVPKPSDITLEEAMKSVGKGLTEMKEAQGDMRTGLLPSEVTVSFNVTASASDSKKLAVSFSSPQMPQVPVSGSITGDTSSAISASRGNVITIKFTNLLFAPKDQLITMKQAADIDGILDTLKKQGITVFLVRSEEEKLRGESIYAHQIETANNTSCSNPPEHVQESTISIHSKDEPNVLLEFFWQRDNKLEFYSKRRWR